MGAGRKEAPYGGGADDDIYGELRACEIPRDSVPQVPLPAVLPLPEELTAKKTIAYDPALAASLAAVVKETLEVPQGTDLGRLHETGRGVMEQSRRAAEGRSGRLTGYHRQWQARMRADPALWERFQIAYQTFLRAVVVPDLEEEEELIFQVWPTFRCHLPDTSKGIGRRHRDYDYHHPAIEVNYWIPVGCDTFDSNSLYCETSPGKQDFTAFRTKGTELIRFYGNALEHFTVANATDTTRVSLDARVIRSKDYYNAALDRGHKGNPKPDLQFVIGRYYSVLKPSEPLEVGVRRAVLYLHPRLAGEGEIGGPEGKADADSGSEGGEDDVEAGQGLADLFS